MRRELSGFDSRPGHCSAALHTSHEANMSATHERYTHVIGRAVEHESVESFGITDSKGREIGYSIMIQREVYAPVATPAGGGYTIPAGVYFVAYTWTLRAGRNYGAIGTRIVERTFHAALVKAIDRRDKARERAAKQFVDWLLTGQEG